jgi:predicted permease
MVLAVPALIFTALMKTRIDPAALTALSLAAVVAYGGLTVLFFALTRLLRLDRRVWLAPLIFGNTGNVGLPLALFAFGQTGLEYAVVIFAVMILWNFTFGLWVVAGGGSVTRVLREPAMLATLAGALFLSQGWHTPGVLTNALDLLAQLAIPLMLLTLGVAVARLAPAHMGRAVWLSLLRAAVCTATALAAGLALSLPPTALAVLILQITTPVAVTSYMLAQKYDADPAAVAGLVVASTLLSVVTLPLTLVFLL